jgi:hypothetical protein
MSMTPVATTTVATVQISPVAIVEITHVATVLICSGYICIIQTCCRCCDHDHNMLNLLMSLPFPERELHLKRE